MVEKVVLELKIPRGAEETPEAMAGVFASLANIKSPRLASLLRREKPLFFEIAAYNQSIHFYVVLPVELQTYFESQLSAQYPKVTFLTAPDYLEEWQDDPALTAGQLKLSSSFYLPLRTYGEFKETDPLSSVLGTMSRAEKDEKFLMQVAVLPIGGGQRKMAKILSKGVTNPEGVQSPHPQARLIELKMSQPGFKGAVRLLTSFPTKAASKTLLTNLTGSFGAMSLGEGNSLSSSKPSFWQEKKFLKAIINRQPGFFPRNQVFNTAELATFYHLPGESLAGIKNIAWGTKLTGEPPENLPIGFDASEEEKKQINFFARTDYKSQVVTYGTKKDDRRKHMYVVGKTGTGKSTLIANMAINDMRNKEGLAVVDPHGDLSDIMLDFVPSHRLNDVCYLEPADVNHPFYLNPLEVKNPEHRELAASGIVAIFYKLYQNSWGPRLEYILRNVIMTLIAYPGSTLVQVPEILTNRKFREKVVASIDDPVLKNFWLKEYNAMGERLQAEAISPILNKVGQFISSPTIRNIIGHPNSTVDLEELMNDGKILILNLSQGRLGEDNAALLGAMFITKIQLAAMNRVGIKEEERRDFYLYVDEFQSFATTSFIKILSEARKYRLNLCLANQYIGQVPEDVQKAIFGNVGTLMAFLVGAEDAQILSREFGGIYTAEELVALGNFQIINKIAIDNLTSRPFYAFTLPLPRSRNQNRNKVIRLSQERYTKKPSNQNINPLTPPSQS